MPVRKPYIDYMSSVHYAPGIRLVRSAAACRAQEAPEGLAAGFGHLGVKNVGESVH